MDNDEFRRAYFDQYAEDDHRCDDAWFASYFDEAKDWMEVEYRGHSEGDESFTIYSDPDSDVGGYWILQETGLVEGPYQTMSEVAIELGFAPGSFPPDGGEAEDIDDLDGIDLVIDEEDEVEDAEDGDEDEDDFEAEDLEEED